VQPQVAAGLAQLRAAIEGQRRTWFVYTGHSGERSERTVRPLGLFFWGTTWTLAAWCELREDFRNFRLDRIGDMKVLDAVFWSERGTTLDDYYRAMERE